MDVSLVGPRGGGRVWVIWVIGRWNMSAVVVEKSTRDPCVDAGRRDECRGGWVTRDGTGDVDARVASRGSFGRERGGRASVVCVCVCVCGIRPRVARVDVAFARASGVRIRIRATNPRRIDRSRARGGGDRARGVDGVARASSVRHGRAGERESWEKNDASIERDGSDARARARGGGRGARAAGGADGARRGGGGARGGESRGFVRRERAEREEWTRVDGEKCGERGREGVDVQGDGGGRIGTRRGGRRRGERARVAEKTSGSAARHLGVEGDEHGWRR